jgi:hypothetical protein
MGRFLARRFIYTALTIVLASIALFLLFEMDPETVAVQARRTDRRQRVVA